MGHLKINTRALSHKDERAQNYIFKFKAKLIW